MICNIGFNRDIEYNSITLFKHYSYLKALKVFNNHITHN